MAEPGQGKAGRGRGSMESRFRAGGRGCGHNQPSYKRVWFLSPRNGVRQHMQNGE